MTRERKLSRTVTAGRPLAASGAPDPADSDVASPVERTLDYKIGVLRKALDRYSSPVVSELGLTLAEWRVLTHIRAGASVTASWLCERLLADKAEVSRACASLIEQGLVATRPNPADARSNLLRLTATGRATYARILPARLALDSELSARLSSHEHAALCDMLDRLTATMLHKIAEIHKRSHEKD